MRPDTASGSPAFLSHQVLFSPTLPTGQSQPWKLFQELQMCHLLNPWNKYRALWQGCEQETQFVTLSSEH